jgi:hypothetical protein
MQDSNLASLIHGFDTVQCAYYLGMTKVRGLDFDSLTREREGIRESKSKVNLCELALGEAKGVLLGEPKLKKEFIRILQNHFDFAFRLRCVQQRYFPLITFFAGRLESWGPERMAVGKPKSLLDIWALFNYTVYIFRLQRLPL